MILAIFILLTSPAHASGNLKIQEHIPPISTNAYSKEYVEDKQGLENHELIFDEKLRRYYAYTSRNSNPNTQKPLIILLHGANRTGASMADMWRQIADQNDVVLIAPTALSGAWPIDLKEVQFLEALITAAKSQYSIDPNRVYLFGHSAGATFSLYVSIYSDMFAATALHAGKFKNPKDGTRVLDAKRKIPIAFINGTHDQLFSVDAVKHTAQAFADSGHETELHILRFHNHWYYTLAPYINQMAWDFLKRHKL